MSKLGRPDFIGGIDNEALDFGHLEPFIHVTNDVSAPDSQLITIGESTPHLPESPPDSGSEPPYSPADLHVLGRTGAQLDTNISSVIEIINHEPQSITKKNKIHNHSIIITPEIGTASNITTSINKDVDDVIQNDLPSIDIQHSDVAPIKQSDGVTEMHQAIPNTNVLYLRNKEELSKQSANTANVSSNNILLKPNEVIITRNGSSSLDSQHLQLHKQVHILQFN